MEYTIDSAAEKLLSSFHAYYNVKEYTEDEENAQIKGLPLRALCEYYEKSQKYVLSQKAELWSENSEEFLFLFQVEHLTKELFEKCKNYAWDEGTHWAGSHVHLRNAHVCLRDL